MIDGVRARSLVIVSSCHGAVPVTPINLLVSHVSNFGKQPVSLAVGERWSADTVEDGPDWGLRAVVTFLFPTGG